MRFILFGFIYIIHTFSYGAETVQLNYSPSFILSEILKYKSLNLRQDIAVPLIKFESQSPLIDFQNDVEEQWGQRPNVLTNAYIVKKNIIYLIDEKNYYERHHRCIDDSLAHEMAHFIQAKYRSWDLNDDSLELEAIDIQNWFRQNYCP